MGGILATLRRSAFPQYVTGNFHPNNVVGSLEIGENGKQTRRKFLLQSSSADDVAEWKRIVTLKMRINRDYFSDALDDVCIQCRQLRQAHDQWYYTSSEFFRLIDDINWKVFTDVILDKSLVRVVMEEMPRYYSAVGDQIVTLKALDVLLFCIQYTSRQLNLVRQSDPNSPEVFFTKEHLNFLSNVWSTCENSDVVEKIGEIFSKLLKYKQYQDTLLEHFNAKHLITTAADAKKYLPIMIHYSKDRVPFPMKFMNLVTHIPNFLRYVIRSAAILINTWHLFDGEGMQLEARWCFERYKTLMSLIHGCSAIELKSLGLERLIRVAIHVLIENSDGKSLFFGSIIHLVDLVFDGDDHDMQNYLSFILPEQSTDDSSQMKDIKNNFDDQKKMYPLLLSDLELVSPPEFIRKGLRQFSDSEICFEPVKDCISMLDTFLSSLQWPPPPSYWAVRLRFKLGQQPSEKTAKAEDPVH